MSEAEPAPTRLRLSTEDLDDHPAADVAVSRAILVRVHRGELPATMRLSRPRHVVAFGSRDTSSPGFGQAVAAAIAGGFDAVVRLAGGRAAVFTPGTIAFSLAVPDPEPVRGIEVRFRWMATLLASALSDLGVDARIGEVPGEYCPGAWSVNARGAVKLVGIGQRLVSKAAHTGGVIVVQRAAEVRTILEPVYRALDLDWDPATVGAVEDERPDVTWEDVRDAVIARLEHRIDVERWTVDASTLALARQLEPDHLPVRDERPDAAHPPVEGST